MIELLLGQEPAPTTFAIGGSYVLGFQVDGGAPSKAIWSLGRRTEAKSQGIDKVIFEPVAAEPYYLNVQADGQETIFVLSVTTTGISSISLSVSWSDPSPRDRKPLRATIQAGGPVQSIGWSILYNNVPVQSGTGSEALLQVVTPGIYRLIATALDAFGNTVVADSSIAVPSPYGLQSVVVPQQPSEETLYHIGDVYSPLVEGGAVQCSYLPYELVNLMSVVKLVPGTTHFKVELDPANPVIDDEVIVRTAHGNWTLNGPPTGLSTEAMPYDYRHGQPVQPAALDLSVRYVIEALNVHGSVASAYRFRVVFRCYRAGSTLFRYSPCDWSAYYGGAGERQRRVVALITKVDVVLDAEWPDKRLGGGELETFTVPNQKRVVGSFTVTGSPDRPVYQEDHFYTDQNAVARYESPGGELRDLTVSCAYGLPGVRPCYLDFSQPASPRIIQRIKQLYGKLVLYVAGGAFSPGTYVHVRIFTGKSPGYVTVSVPVRQGVYNPDYGSYAKIGEADIGIVDFEFDRIGILMDFRVDDTLTQSGTAAYDPMHQVAENAYYSSINSPAIKVDSACFRDPVTVPVFEGTFAGSAVPLPDCNRLPCGPVGVYCYTNVTTGTIPPTPNTPPVADPQSLTTPQDTPLGVTLTATDAETPFSLAYTLTVGPNHGAISGNPAPPDITYTPDAGWYGEDAFTFQATDPGFLSSAAQVTITVIPAPPNNVNHPPSATPQFVSLDQDTTLGIVLAGTDPDGDSIIAYVVTVAPAHGGLTGVAPNLTYTPDPGYSGPDSFQFTVTDNGTPNLTSDVAAVGITVNSTSAVFYVAIGAFNPDGICSAFVPGGLVNNIYSVDGNPCLFELVSTEPFPVVVPIGDGVRVFLVKVDQRLLDIGLGPPMGEEAANKIAFEMLYDRWQAAGGDPDTCAFGSQYHFAVTIGVIIAGCKAQQDGAVHAGTLDDPFTVLENPS